MKINGYTAELCLTDDSGNRLYVAGLMWTAGLDQVGVATKRVMNAVDAAIMAGTFDGPAREWRVERAR